MNRQPPLEIYSLKIKGVKDGSGDAIIEVTNLLLNKLKWKEGDELQLKKIADGSVKITKTPKGRIIELNPLNHEQVK